MIILTILNTVAILYLVASKALNLYVSIRKVETFSNNTLVGYNITFWKRITEHSAKGVFSICFPLKNKQKIELKEEIERISKGSRHNKIQTLNAKFSWLKTWKEVGRFEKDYSDVDKEIVENLVLNFVPIK